MKNNIYDLVRNAIHLEWDPIGVGEAALELREYDSYVAGLCHFLSTHPSEKELFDQLWFIETQSIGLEGNLESTQLFAKRLLSITM